MTNNVAARTELYPRIIAGQNAVRAVEIYATPDDVATLYGVLCGLPVNVLDDQADRILHDAIRALALAEDAEEWALLNDVKQRVAQYLREPGAATMAHPAVQAVIQLTSGCGSRFGRQIGDPIERTMWEVNPERRAWERAYLLGLEVLRELSAAIYGEGPQQGLYKELQDFEGAVRRAIAYGALYEARRALVEVARSYGLFVVGMRQPTPVGGRWEWARRIGSATYLFEVEPPHINGDPYGAVAVLRIAEDGTHMPVRYIPLGSDEKRRRALTKAQYRI
jgi:hypothetical protein